MKSPKKTPAPEQYPPDLQAIELGRRPLTLGRILGELDPRDFEVVMEWLAWNIRDATRAILSADRERIAGVLRKSYRRIRMSEDEIAAKVDRVVRDIVAAGAALDHPYFQEHQHEKVERISDAASDMFSSLKRINRGLSNQQIQSLMSAVAQVDLTSVDSFNDFLTLFKPASPAAKRTTANQPNRENAGDNLAHNNVNLSQISNEQLVALLEQRKAVSVETCKRLRREIAGTSKATPSRSPLPAESAAYADEIANIKERLARLPVSQATVAKTVEAVEREIENLGRATWKPDPKKPDAFLHLRHLTAPQFLKEVWKDKIKNGRIPREAIKEYDPALLTALTTYISQRKSRNLDAGDAKGLVVVDLRKKRPGRPPTL